MLFLRATARATFADALLDMASGNRAVGADVIGLGVAHQAEHRAADFHRLFKVLAFYAPGAVVPGAALDGRDLGLRHHLQQFAGLLTHVLHAQMAGNVIRHLAQRFFELFLQQTVLVAQHQIFKRIVHGCSHGFDIGVIREHQRQFLLEHQRTRRHRAEYRVALTRQFCQHRNIEFLVALDRLQITEFEFGHATAGLLLDDDRRNFVMGKDLQQIMADAGLVVVHITGRENCDLARRLLAVPDRK